MSDTASRATSIASVYEDARDRRFSAVGLDGAGCVEPSTDPNRKDSVGFDLPPLPNPVDRIGSIGGALAARPPMRKGRSTFASNLGGCIAEEE